MKNIQTLLKKCICITLWCVTFLSHAQCPAGDYLFGAQEKVNQFFIDYHDCTAITGHATILFAYDLSPLNSLTSSEGTLFIAFNQNPVNLDGLSSLTSLGRLTIQGNPNPANSSGLQNSDPGSISNLQIQGNLSVQLCNLPNLCDFPGNISGNAYNKFNLTKTS